MPSETIEPLDIPEVALPSEQDDDEPLVIEVEDGGDSPEEAPKAQTPADNSSHNDDATRDG